MSESAVDAVALLSGGSWHEYPFGTVNGAEPGSRLFQRVVPDGHLTAIVSRHPRSARWHLSVSHRRNVRGPDGLFAAGRYPTWDELAEARYRFVPDVATMVMVLPPRAEYVNVMPTCFHFYEVAADFWEGGGG